MTIETLQNARKLAAKHQKLASGWGSAPDPAGELPSPKPPEMAPLNLKFLSTYATGRDETLVPKWRDRSICRAGSRRDETLKLKLRNRDEPETCDEEGRSRRDVPPNSIIFTQVRSVTTETMNLVIYINLYLNLMIFSLNRHLSH